MLNCLTTKDLYITSVKLFNILGKQGKKEAKREESTIFTYSTIHLKYKDKIRFYYALKGRDGKTGIIQKLKIRQLGKTVLLVNSKNSKEANQFLEFWKCKFEKKDIIISSKSAVEGYTKNIIFTYSTRHLPYKDKIRFYYALKGRDGKSGIIKQAKINQLGKTVLLVSQKQDKETREFLEFWKCEFERVEIFTKKNG